MGIGIRRLHQPHGTEKVERCIGNTKGADREETAAIRQQRRHDQRLLARLEADGISPIVASRIVITTNRVEADDED